MGKKKYDLTPLTTRQRIECFDTEGRDAMMYKFAMYGLGLEKIEDFDKPENFYPRGEISEIAAQVMEESGKGANPTTGGS